MGRITGSPETAAAALERGWSFLEAGRAPEAERECERAEAACPELPDTLHLRGAVAETRGDPDAALALYRRAAAADADYPGPRLGAAGLLLARGDLDDAEELLDEALSAADGDELVDAALVAADLARARRDAGSALPLLEEAASQTDDPDALLSLAYALVDAGDPQAGEHAFRRASERGAPEADARYGLGLAAGARGDRRGAVREWLEVARLDAAAPPPSFHLSDDAFEATAERAFAELPDRVIELLENVPLLIDEAPSEELVGEGMDPRLLGLFSGLPLPEKSQLGGAVPQVDAVYLFRRNLERSCRDKGELAEQIRITVLHETAHFFGLEDDDLERLGLG